jgi:hypothetical protein
VNDQFVVASAAVSISFTNRIGSQEGSACTGDPGIQGDSEYNVGSVTWVGHLSEVSNLLHQTP